MQLYTGASMLVLLLTRAPAVIERLFPVVSTNSTAQDDIIFGHGHIHTRRW